MAQSPALFRACKAVRSLMWMLAASAATLWLTACGGTEEANNILAARTPTYYSWMSPDVRGAWNDGYFGQGTRVTVVDQFNSGTEFRGKLTNKRETKLHGDWVLQQSGMIATGSELAFQDFYIDQPVALKAGALNIINLSYGYFSTVPITWGRLEGSILSYSNGAAVVVKAAGNEGVGMGELTASGKRDYLAVDLIGDSSAIFAGALSSNGTTSARASMASYSNFAGTNTTVQNQFLVVGVESGITGLAGTSFAAPVISGYAAIVGSKFTDASANEIANQLLSTARQDTIAGYSAAVHGRGEASLARALAPASIR